MEFEIDYKDAFKSRLKNLSHSERKKVLRFIKAFNEDGFEGISKIQVDGFSVRNKPSTDVHKDDPSYLKKIRLATDERLFHFHAGFYNTSANEYPIDNGYKRSHSDDLVSQWLLHYRVVNEKTVALLDLRSHPPVNVLTLVW